MITGGLSLFAVFPHPLSVNSSWTSWRTRLVGGVLPELPDKIGTVKLKQSVTLLAMQEHLVWGKLPNNALMSPGSTVLVEPTSSKSMPCNIMVGRVVTPLWGDRWVPMKVTNLSYRPVTLKRICKLADVSPCLAVEDFELLQGYNEMLALTNLTYSLVRLAPQEL